MAGADPRERTRGSPEKFGGGAAFEAARPGLHASVLADRAMLSIGAAFEREFEAGRGFLWLPVAFGAGALLYFALPGEPAAIALVGLSLVLATLTWRAREGRAGLLRLLLAATMLACGVAAMKLRTDYLATPTLERQVTGTVTGWVEARTARAGGFRLTIRVESFDGARIGTVPRRVNVTVRGEAPSVGDGVSVLARLRPASGPALPGSYDFGRNAFYQGIGATGFGYGAAKPADLGPAPLSIRMLVPLQALREAIRARIVAVLPGDVGRVATALVIGDAGGISASAEDAMRNSGLAHILSVSGLHMVLVAGAVFWCLRALLALSPTLALRRPIKKWAAAGAIGVTGFYLLISGLDVAAQRSFIMTAIVFVAVTLDRRALSMRNVAIAALIVLAIAPESILAAGFQMSFAATVALVAGFEALSARRRAKRSIPLERSWMVAALRWVAALVAGLAVTSLLGGIGTTPFALYHFQRMAPLSIVANVVAMPLVDFLVMPLALASVLVMPFGIEAPFLKLMGAGIDGMLAVARAVSDWSEGSGGAAMPSATSLLVFIAGFLWLTLIGGRWRLAGLAPMLLGGVLAFLPERPDLVVAADGRAVAIRAADGRYAILAKKADGFTTGIWLRADGDPREARARALSSGSACDASGCIAKLPDGRLVALTLDRAGFAEDCRRAALVVTPLAAPEACARRTAVIDGDRLRQTGSLALSLRRAGRGDAIAEIGASDTSQAASAFSAPPAAGVLSDTGGATPIPNSADPATEDPVAANRTAPEPETLEREPSEPAATGPEIAEPERTAEDEDAWPASEGFKAASVPTDEGYLERRFEIRTAYPPIRRPWMPPLAPSKRPG